MRKLRRWPRWEGIFEALGFGRRETPRGTRLLKCRPLHLEPLEERALLTVLYWDPDGTHDANFGGAGNWTATDAWEDSSGNRYTWDGGRSGDEAVFQGTAGTVTLGSSISAAKLTFQTDSYTLTGSTITLTGSTAIAATQSDTINSAITLGANQTWTVDSGETLTVGGNVSTAGYALSVQGDGATSVTSVISGAGSLSKSGSGTLTLSGANTYSGNTTINAGTLKAGSSSALPSGSGKGNVAVDGTLDLNGYSITVNKLSGSGTVTSGAAGAATLTVDVSTLGDSSTFSGVIQNGAGTVGLTKTGSGKLVLSGALANTYTGMTTVNAESSGWQLWSGYAELLLNKSAGVNAIGGDLTIASSGSGCAIVVLGANEQLPDTSVITFTGPAYGSYFRLLGRTETVAGIVNSMGGGAAVIENSEYDSGSGDGTLIINNTANYTWNGYLRDNWSGFGKVSVVKQGSGTLTFSGNNITYTGNTTISAGTLKVGGSSALPGGSGKGNVAVDGTLDLNGYSITVNNLSGSGTVTSSVAGAVTLTEYAPSAGDSSTFSGVIQDGSGTVGLTKDGSGTLTLSGSNTYAGATTVSAGTLKMGSSSALPSGSGKGNVAVASTLDLNGYSVTVNKLSGSGTVTSGVAGAATLTVYVPNLGDSSTFSGVIQNGSGTVGLTKTGSGKLVLSGASANTYTGMTTVNAESNGWQLWAGYAELLLNKSAGVNAIGGDLTIVSSASGCAIVALGANEQIANTSVVTFTGPSYGAYLRLLGRTETVGGIVSSMSGGAAVISNAEYDSGSGDGTLIVNNTADCTWGGYLRDNVSGFGKVSVVKQGSGTLTFTGSNITYSGNTTISAGTLKAGSTSALPSGSGKGNVAVDGTLDLNGYSITVNNLSGSGTVTSGVAGAATLTVYVPNLGDTSTFSGVIQNGSGTVGLTKTGSGKLVLGGTSANTYTGMTTVNSPDVGWNSIGDGYAALALSKSAGVNAIAGDLTINSSSSGCTVVAVTANEQISDTSVVTFTGPTGYGSYFRLLGHTETVAGIVNSMSGGYAVISNSEYGSGSGNGTLIISNTSNYSWNAFIRDNYSGFGTLSLVKAGTGTLTLSGTNITYTNGTTINAGMLALSGGDNRLSTSGAITITGGTLDLGGYSQTTSGAVSIQGGAVQNGTISKSGAAYDGQGGTVSAVLSGGVGLSKTGAGTLTLSGANTYSGGTTISAGTLALSGNDDRLSTSGAITITAGTLDLGGYTQHTSAAVSFQGGTVQNGTISKSGADYDGKAGTVSAVLAGTAGLTKSTTSTLTLSGANTYSGTTTVSAGTLILTGDNTSCSGATTISGGTLQVGDGGTSGTLGGGTVTDNATLVFNRSNAYTYGGAIGGSGAVTKNGSGTLTLSGANAYSGGTTINAGTLALSGADDRLSTSGAITITAGTLDLGGYTQHTSGAVSFQGGTVQNGTLSKSGAAYDGQAGTVSAVLTGSVALNKTTSGTLTLTGTNSYSGGTTISAGTLCFASGGLGTSGTITFPQPGSGTLQWATGNTEDVSGRISLAAGATAILDIGANNITFWGSIGVQDQEPSGSLTKDGSGTLTFAANNSPNIDGITVNAGTLQIGNGGTAGRLGAGMTTLSNNAALIFNRSNNYSYSEVIQGTGSLTLSEYCTGTLTLSGANTYTGGTTINAGTLALSGNDDRLSTSGAITISGGTLDLGAHTQTTSGAVSFQNGTVQNGTISKSGAAYDGQAGTVSAVLDGSVGLTKTTSGTLTLSGTNTYSGATTVNAGELRVTSSISLSAVTVNDGTLSGTGTTGTVTVDDGALSPGVGGVGTLNTQSLDLSEDATCAVDLTDGGADMVDVTGTVDLGGATLDITSTRADDDGDVLVLIRNNGTDAIVGTFADLSEGDAVTVNDVLYFITYTYNAEAQEPGTGNDVALIDYTPSEAVADTYQTWKNHQLSDNVLENDVQGFPADPIWVSQVSIVTPGGTTNTPVPYGEGVQVTTPKGGLLSIDSDGDFTYTPPTDFKGNDGDNTGTNAILYVISDGVQTSEPVYLQFVVTAPIHATGGTSVEIDEGSSTGNVVWATMTDDTGNTDPDEYTAEIDWGDQSTTSGTVTYDSQEERFEISGSHVYADDDQYTVTVTVENTDDDSTEAESSATADNVAPDMDISGDGATYRFSEYTLTLDEVVDPGDDTVQTYLVHWGDNQSDSYTAAEVEALDRQVTHTYTASGNVTITVDLTDEDGTYTGVATKPVTVIYTVPVVTIAAAQNATEGGDDGYYTLTRDDTAGSLTVNYTIDVSSTAIIGDDYTSPGYFDGEWVPGGTVTFAVGNSTATLDLLAVNDEVPELVKSVIVDLASGGSYTIGDPGTATAYILDNDVIVNADEVNEGEVYTLTLAPTDGTPWGPADEYVVHWGDGHQNTYTTAYLISVDYQVTHNYPDGPSEPTITVDLICGATTYPGADTLKVTVDNMPPFVVTVYNQQVNVNNELSITDLATFTDLGFTDLVTPTYETFTYSIDWGDGSDLETGVPTIDVPGDHGVLTQGSIDGAHTYDEGGIYTVTVTVTDDDEGVGVGLFNVQVHTAPTVAVPAAPADDPITSTSTTLSVLGASDEGEWMLDYTWSVISKPAGATDPTFDINGTNSAKDTVVTFSSAGAYGFRVTIVGPGGLSTTSDTSVTVNQGLTSIVVTPESSYADAGSTQDITAVAYDQFGDAMATQPTFDWDAVYGSITAGGVYTAPNQTIDDTVTATSGGITGSAIVRVTDWTPVPVEIEWPTLNPIVTEVDQAGLALGDTWISNVFAEALNPTGTLRWQVHELIGDITVRSGFTVSPPTPIDPDIPNIIWGLPADSYTEWWVGTDHYERTVDISNLTSHCDVDAEFDQYNQLLSWTYDEGLTYTYDITMEVNDVQVSEVTGTTEYSFDAEYYAASGSSSAYTSYDFDISASAAGSGSYGPSVGPYSTSGSWSQTVYSQHSAHNYTEFDVYGDPSYTEWSGAGSGSTEASYSGSGSCLIPFTAGLGGSASVSGSFSSEYDYWASYDQTGSPAYTGSASVSATGETHLSYSGSASFEIPEDPESDIEGFGVTSGSGAKDDYYDFDATYGFGSSGWHPTGGSPVSSGSGYTYRETHATGTNTSYYGDLPDGSLYYTSGTYHRDIYDNTSYEYERSASAVGGEWVHEGAETASASGSKSETYTDGTGTFSPASGSKSGFSWERSSGTATEESATGTGYEYEKHYYVDGNGEDWYVDGSGGNYLYLSGSGSLDRDGSYSGSCSYATVFQSGVGTLALSEGKLSSYSWYEYFDLRPNNTWIGASGAGSSAESGGAYCSCSVSGSYVATTNHPPFSGDFAAVTYEEAWYNTETSAQCTLGVWKETGTGSASNSGGGYSWCSGSYYSGFSSGGYEWDTEYEYTQGSYSYLKNLNLSPNGTWTAVSGAGSADGHCSQHLMLSRMGEFYDEHVSRAHITGTTEAGEIEETYTEYHTTSVLIDGEWVTDGNAHMTDDYGMVNWYDAAGRSEHKDWYWDDSWVTAWAEHDDRYIYEAQTYRDYRLINNQWQKTREDCANVGAEKQDLEYYEILRYCYYGSAMVEGELTHFWAHGWYDAEREFVSTYAFATTTTWDDGGLLDREGGELEISASWGQKEEWVWFTGEELGSVGNPSWFLTPDDYLDRTAYGGADPVDLEKRNVAASAGIYPFDYFDTYGIEDGHRYRCIETTLVDITSSGSSETYECTNPVRGVRHSGPLINPQGPATNDNQQEEMYAADVDYPGYYLWAYGVGKYSITDKGVQNLDVFRQETRLTARLPWLCDLYGIFLANWLDSQEQERVRPHIGPSPSPVIADQVFANDWWNNWES